MGTALRGSGTASYRRTRTARLTGALLASCTFALLPGMAQADEAETTGSGKDEIVVTGRATTGTKVDTDIMQVPQSVSVITAQDVKDRAAVNFQDIFRYSAGVQTESQGVDTRGDFMSARGFDTVQYLDGINRMPSFVYGARMDVFTLERAEVLRGPSSVLYGAGGAGGMFNGVSKRPQETFGGEIDVIYGTDDTKQINLDVTGPITEGVSARLVGVARDGNLQQPSQKNNRLLLMPSVTFKPGPDTEITVLGLYQKDRLGSQTYLPISKTIGADNDSVKVSPDTFLGEPGYNHTDTDYKAASLLVTQRFGDNVTFSSNTRYFKNDIDYAEVYGLATYADTERTLVNRAWYVMQQQSKGVATDNRISVKLTTGPVEHQLLFGVDYTWFNQSSDQGWGYDLGGFDIYNPTYGQTIPTTTFWSPRTTNTQLGFYFQDQMRLWDRVSVVLGGRHDKATSKADGVKLPDNTAWTFRAGVIGDVTDTFSVYANYAESFLPVFGQSVQGQVYVPRTGRQYEAGVKFQPFRGALLSAAVFDIKENNGLQADPNDIQNIIQRGQVKSRGVEVEGSLRLPGDVNVTAAYTYLDAHNLNDDGSNGLRLANLPKHAASVWGTKNFALTDKIGARVGGGIRYTGEKPDSFENFTTPSYTLVDAMFEVTYDKWSLGINASNIFDTTVYTNCNWDPANTEGYCYLGKDRTILATLRRTF
ncbi:TonB-dependent siderophore receptor [Novosphingobium resinovorum]|uniref:TonB-dependent siderophore receptor n=1 Tax=Novosphingobium resinovorum TaxID=158500 RepID=UPI002ED4E16E|nr:TonB-dependent siderophore receptor [Novosphingobium resinovorum]